MSWVRWDESVYSDAAIRDLGIAAFGDRDLGESYWAKFLLYVYRRHKRGKHGMVSAVDGQSLMDAGVGGTAKRWAKFLAVLLTSELVSVEGANWTVRRWQEYQPDPTAAERQARARAKARDSPITGSHSDVTGVTPPEKTETEPEKTRQYTRRPKPNGSHGNVADSDSDFCADGGSSASDLGGRAWLGWSDRQATGHPKPANVPDWQTWTVEVLGKVFATRQLLENSDEKKKQQGSSDLTTWEDIAKQVVDGEGAALAVVALARDKASCRSATNRRGMFVAAAKKKFAYKPRSFRDKETDVT